MVTRLRFAPVLSGLAAIEYAICFGARWDIHHARDFVVEAIVLRPSILGRL
jgi:hypothetical protein